MGDFPSPSMSTRPVIRLATDGSCHNPGVGGWGWVLDHPEKRREHKGSCAEQTTSQRMEISGVIDGLRTLRRPCRVEVVTDSRYVINAARNGCRAKANRDLLKDLKEQLDRHRVTFRWVKGHSGDEDNERAHELANEGRQEALVRAEEDRKAREPGPNSDRFRAWLETPAQRLYPYLVHREDEADPPMVMTPDGPGKLYQSFSDYCQVLLLTPKREERRYGKTGRKFFPMEKYPPEKVRGLSLPGEDRIVA